MSYGFHKGSGVEKAVTTARKIRKDHRWVLKSDIHSFFNQIQRDTLKRDIAKTLKNRSVVPLLFSAIDAEAKHEGPHDKARLEALGIQTGLGLRQGMPLSPLLSNVVLRDFDLGIVQEKFKMVRYADDFVILCDNENECKEALDLVTKLLAAKEHTVPPLGPHSKTVVYSPDQSVEFLGFDISPAKNAYTLVAPQGVFERVNELCNPFENYADCKAEWKTLARALQSLNTKLFSFTNSYRIAANFDALRTHANNRKRQTVTDLLASILEVRAIPTLSPEKLLFLDVDPGE